MTSTQTTPRITLTRRGTVRLIATRQAECVSEPGPRLSGPECAGRVLIQLIGGEDREHFVALHLDASHRIVAAETVSVGTLNGTQAHPREVFKAAILANALAIICGHNHPSGDLEPSREDRMVSEKLQEAGKLLGIPVLDFLVVSRSGFRSLLPD